MEKVTPTLLKERKFAELKAALSEMNSADVAVILEEMPEEELPVLFRLLPKELAAETFVELDPELQENLILAFSDRELREVLEEMYVDDAVDLVEEMPATMVKRILKQAAPEMRKEINDILKYPKDSAGSIMTTEYVDLKKHMTVDEAFQRIRATGVDKETIYTCYVTDSNRKLIGLVTAKTLLLSPKDAVIEDIMETNVIYATTLEDQEEVGRNFGKYDFLALPVVDGEGRLVGIITVDDVIDVIQEEATEDIEKMAAIVPTDKPYLKTSVWETFKNRAPWLMLLMISSTFTGKIIGAYEGALAACVALTAFIPMLSGTGGNSGGQSSVTIIRALSLNDVEMKDIFKILRKEFLVALLCGVCLAAVNFVKMMIVDRNLLLSSGQNPVLVAAVVSLTLICTVVCAKLVGSGLPILVKRVGLDPAVMASPFVSTVVDIISLLIYFRIATALLPI